MNPENVSASIAAGSAVIVSCTRMHPLRPGYRRGFYCVSCSVEVQASPRGAEQIAAGGVVMCNSCGISLAEAAREAGKFGGIVVSPEAQDVLSRGTSAIDPARIERLKKVPPPDESLCCDFCGAAAAGSPASPGPPGLWVFPHLAFSVEARIDQRRKEARFEAGGWAACDDCARLFELGHVDGLLERASPNQKQSGIIRRVYQTLLRHRNGPPRWSAEVVRAR